MSHLALAGAEHGDIGIALILVDLVENGLPRAHTVPAFGIVSTAPDRALILPPLDHLLGMIKMPVQLLDIAWSLQVFHQIHQGPGSLFLQIGADVHIVPGNLAEGGDGAQAGK